tara:strand:+ start:3132 stop:3335 length:204 start_codon:yes stop_codon:yes gene_type:complete
MSRVNPALTAYLNLPEVEDTDIKKSDSITRGLLGKRKGKIEKATDKTPIERVAIYAAAIRKARMELT